MYDALNWNTSDLVEMAVTGPVSQPAIRQGACLRSPDGRATTLGGIGVVCSTDGPRGGDGPGITLLLTAPAGELGRFDAPEASIADRLALEP